MGFSGFLMVQTFYSQVKFNEDNLTNNTFHDRCVNGKGIICWKEMDFSKDSLEKKAKWWNPHGTDESGKNSRKKIKSHCEKKKVVRFNLRPDREKMNQRMCISEHPFGTIK